MPAEPAEPAINAAPAPNAARPLPDWFKTTAHVNPNKAEQLERDVREFFDRADRDRAVGKILAYMLLKDSCKPAVAQMPTTFDAHLAILVHAQELAPDQFESAMSDARMVLVRDEVGKGHPGQIAELAAAVRDATNTTGGSGETRKKRVIAGVPFTIPSTLGPQETVLQVFENWIATDLRNAELTKQAMLAALRTFISRAGMSDSDMARLERTLDTLATTYDGFVAARKAHAPTPVLSAILQLARIALEDAAQFRLIGAARAKYWTRTQEFARSGHFDPMAAITTAQQSHASKRRRDEN